MPHQNAPFDVLIKEKWWGGPQAPYIIWLQWSQAGQHGALHYNILIHSRLPWKFIQALPLVGEKFESIIIY